MKGIPHLLSALLIATGLLIVGFVFYQRHSSPFVEVRGVIALGRLLCERTPDQGSYRVSIVAQNATNRTLDDLTVELNLGSKDKLSQKSIVLGNVMRSAHFQINEEVAAEAKADVCFARFFVDNQEIPARFRP